MSSATSIPTKWRGVSSLKVVWRRDKTLDSVLTSSKPYDLLRRVTRELLRRPLPVRYLDNRRARLGLSLHVPTLVARYPTLFDVYEDSIKGSKQLVPFVRASEGLGRVVEVERRVRRENEGRVLERLCRLVMMTRERAVNVEKLVHVKRDFGFPDDFLTDLIPRYPELLRVVGGINGGPLFLELVSWKEEFAKSVIERRAEEEAERIGIRMRPNFEVRLPPGFFLRKEMREWVRDWLELPYISPYTDVSGLDRASPQMEKRNVAVLHEVLSLTILKRAPVPTVGKFKEEFRLSNEFGSAFTRHPGIFYVSLKGGIKTAILREAYQNGVLVDKDPLLEIKDKFMELVEEGYQQWLEKVRTKREAIEKERKLAAEAEKRCTGSSEEEISETNGNFNGLSVEELRESDGTCN